LSNLDFKYQLKQIPSIRDLILLGLQWLVITIPVLIIIGKVVAGLHFNNTLEQTIYLQKLFFVTAIIILIQIYLGHGLPLIMGPASVLLVGIVASEGSSIDAIYSSIMVGGLVLAILSMTGLFGYLSAIVSGWGVGMMVETMGWSSTITILIGLSFVGLFVFLLAWRFPAHGYGVEEN